jgi:hypothetical protein
MARLLTCALLVSRLGLKEVRVTLEARAEERAEELTRSQGRFRTLFSDLHIATSEQDIRQAKIMVDDLKASGVTDFQAFADANSEWVLKAGQAWAIANGANNSTGVGRLPPGV